MKRRPRGSGEFIAVNLTSPSVSTVDVPLYSLTKQTRQGITTRIRPAVPKTFDPTTAVASDRVQQVGKVKHSAEEVSREMPPSVVVSMSAITKVLNYPRESGTGKPRCRLWLDSLSFGDPHISIVGRCRESSWKSYK